MSKILGGKARDFRIMISAIYFFVGAVLLFSYALRPLEMFDSIGMVLSDFLTPIGFVVAAIGVIIPDFVEIGGPCFLDITGSCASVGNGPGAGFYLLCLAAIALSSVMLYLDLSTDQNKTKMADNFWIFLTALAFAITIGNIVSGINTTATSLDSKPEEILLYGGKDLVWSFVYLFVYFRIRTVKRDHASSASTTSLNHN